MKLMSRFPSKASRTARDFVNNCGGVAAVEFAFIVPLMLVLFFGTIDFSQGVAVSRKVTIMARTLADLTSQNTSVTTTQLNNFFTASTAVMTPYPAAPEICVEIRSFSNSDAEMAEKIMLFLSKGAREVWICDADGNVTFHDHTGALPRSKLALQFPAKI